MSSRQLLRQLDPRPPHHAYMLANAIAAMKREGRTVMIVSHKLSILPVVDKLLVLKNGRIELFGTRDEVLPRIAPPNLRRMPLATPAWPQQCGIFPLRRPAMAPSLCPTPQSAIRAPTFALA